MNVKQIDNYQVEGDAVRTAIGVVRPAIEAKRQEPVRLTVLDPALRQIPQFEPRFAQAAKKASRLRGNGLAIVLDFGRADETLYIVHEAIEGRSPGGRATRRLPPDVSLLLAAVTTRAVARAHGQGVVHGLLTPASLLVSRAGHRTEQNNTRWRATIADFGLPALAAEEMNSVPGLAELALPYCAPERTGQGVASPGADLYSLGAILYYLLTGRPPRSAAAPDEDVAAYLKQQPIPVQELRPDLPSELAALVHKSMSPDPAARFENAEEMVRALGAMVAAAKGNGSRARPTAQKAAAESGSIAVSARPTEVELAPGESAELQVRVRNRGNDIDHVTVKVEDLPRQWTVISQEFVRLAPGTEMALTVTIQPPKHSDARAGDHPFRIVVSTSAGESEATTVAGRLTVRPFSQLRVDAAPLLLEHGSSANVTIKNEGNAPETLTVRGRDPEHALHFSGECQDLTVAPGSTTTVTLRISARSQPAFGAARTVPFSLIVAGDSSLREERNGQLHIPPAIPRWLAMVLAGLLVVATVAGLISLTSPGEDAPGAVAISATPSATATRAQPTEAATDVPPPAAETAALEAEAVAPAAEAVPEGGEAQEGGTTPAGSGEPDVNREEAAAGLDGSEPALTPTAPGDAPAPTLAPPATVEAPEATATTGSGGLIAYQVVDEQGTSEVRLMTSDGLQEQTVLENGTNPVWSPDGRRLAALRPAAAAPAPEQAAAGDVLHVFTTAGTSLGAVTDGGLHISGLNWSPDGTQIAFQGTTVPEDGLGSGEDAGADIYTVASDGGIQRQWTDGGTNVFPVWSPDGSRLLFQRSTPQEAAGALYVVNVGNGSQQQIVSGPELGMAIMDTGHDWSPDGSRIVFSARNDEGDVHVYVADADGSGLLQLTDPEARVHYVAPRWSPAGNRVLYLAAEEGQEWGALQWSAPDGTERGQLAAASRVRSAAWSGDGAQIVFSAAGEGDGLWNLYHVSPDDGEPHLLVEDDVQRIAPAWQPAE